MTISVTQLNNYIKALLDTDGVLNDVSVCGEITNLKRAANGWYFSLKDDFGAINCFSYFTDSELVAGAMAVVEGQVNYFTRTGSISFFVKRLSLTNNLGLAYQRFVELKDKLQKEGLFDDSRKKTVPRCCARIGVVTSETGAVIHDITDVSLRRQPFSTIILFPVKVQGDGADKEIARGVNYFSSSDVDVVIVGRGGGSNEDLSAFNSELVVRAVANCTKPIVSAVGHGIDYTLCDFAADKRAVTPSEAAEFVTLDCMLVKNHIAYSLNKSLSALSDKYTYDLSNMRRNILLSQNCIVRMVNNLSSGVCGYLHNANKSVQFLLEKLQLRTRNVVDRLNVTNPTNVLKRGFSYVSAGNGKVITSVDAVQKGQEINITVCDGEIRAVVTNREKK